MRLLILVLGAFAAALTVASASSQTYAAVQVPTVLATTTDQSFNWAGYVAQGGVYTAVSATWVVPSVDSGAADLAADATWVGIGGVSAADLIQAGTQELVDSDGGTHYEAWYELLPEVSQPVGLAVSPGDSVTVSIMQAGPGHWHIAFVNNTTNKQTSVDVDYDSSLSSAEWIEEMPAAASDRSFIPLDNFGTLSFSSAATVKDGQRISLSEAVALPVSMLNLQGEMLATPSLVGDNGSFSVVRSDVNSVAMEPRARIIFVRF